MAVTNQLGLVSGDSTNIMGILLPGDKYDVNGTEAIERVTDSTTGNNMITTDAYVTAQDADGRDKRGAVMLPFIPNAGGTGINAFGIPNLFCLQTNHNHANDANGGPAKCHFADDY